MSEVTRLPDTSVVLDLDTEERPAEEVVPPFVVKIGGRSITFADPMEMDWRDLAGLETPGELLRVSLSRDDAKFLRDQKLPTWKFSRLMELYSEHHNLEELVRDAQRQAQFGL